MVEEQLLVKNDKRRDLQTPEKNKEYGKQEI